MAPRGSAKRGVVAVLRLCPEVWESVFVLIRLV